MMRTANDKAYDKTYNDTHPNYSLRIATEKLDQIPGSSKAQWIRDAIDARLTNPSPLSEVRQNLLTFLVQTFIDAELELEIPDELEQELLKIIGEMNQNG